MAVVLATCLAVASAAEPTSNEIPLRERVRVALTLREPEAVQRVTSLIGLANRNEQAEILALLPAEKPGFAAVLSAGLRNSEALIQVAAITRIGSCWPTNAEHLTLIRNLIEARDPFVAKAAMSAIALIGDDRPLAQIVEQLASQGEIAQAARRTLISLTGTDAGLEPTLWEPLLVERDKRLATALMSAKVELTSGDVDQVRSALRTLLSLTASRSAVAEMLAPLLSHPDPAIATLARGGLGNLGGGVAQLLLQGGKLPDAFPNPERRTTAVRAQDHTGWFALIAIVCLCALIAFVLFRTPLKDTKAVRNITRAFTRSMVRSGQLRQLKAAQRKVEGTDLYRRGAKGIKQLEESRVYRALVKKPVEETVREATRSFRRKKA